MLHAGSIVFSAEVVGEGLTDLSLLVHRDGLLVADEDWPVTEPNFEFVVNGEQWDGELTFTLEAKSGPEIEDTAQLGIEVDLPEAGSKKLRWVSPAVSRGMALGVVPGTGTARDSVVVVGNDPDDVLLMGVLENGPVPMIPFPKMKVHAVEVTEGFIYVVGERDGSMVARKYTDKLQPYWEFEGPKGRARDVAVGPDGDVYVVGEADVDGMIPHQQAAVWVLTESASPLLTAQFAKFDEWNIPRASSLAAVGIVDERVVVAGYREVDDLEYPPRATLFELIDGELLDIRIYNGILETEQCAWHGLMATSGGLTAIGWHRTSHENPHSVALGNFDGALNEEIYSPAWGGFGIAHSVAQSADGSPVLAGERIVDSTTRFLLQAGNWEYLDEEGAKSWAGSVVVDRHGYIYGLGSVEIEGSPHLLLTVRNP